MSNQNDHTDAYTRARPKLTLDRENRKLLGVCAGFARYLEVPSVLVRVIYCIACVVSPVLLIVYFVLYWLLEDEDRPARIKAALSRKATESGTSEEFAEHRGKDSAETESANRFNLRKPFFRSRSNVRVAGVCAGIADYLNVSTFWVRAITLMSLFILGGITVWGYIILWIVLDKEPKAGRKSDKAELKSNASAAQRDNFVDIERCATNLRAAEQRLQDVEAFITSKQFRLHCEINRI
jgi:phage shock protein C